MKKLIQLFLLAIVFVGIFASNFANAQTKRQDSNAPTAIKLESGDVLLKMNDNRGVQTDLRTSYPPTQGFSPMAANDIYLQSGFEESWTFGAPPGWTFFPPANGLNSWHRTDYNAGWVSNSGGYNPVSYMGGMSARFHPFDAPLGTIGQMNTPDINLSSSTDSVFVSFWFTNSNGTDSLKIFVSTDGGVTYPAYLGFVTLTGGPWVRVFAYIPSTSATTRIRFEAKSDFGTTDIGLDEVIVYQKGSGYSGIINIPGTWGSFTEAARRLTIFGVNGPLTINVSAGTFPDSVTFSPIPGASSINTVRFDNSGGSVNVVRRGALVSNTTIGTTIARTDDAVISLWGADFMAFDSINVSNDGAFTGTEWGYHVRALFPTDGANNNTIQNSLIVMSKTNINSRGIRHFPFWILTSTAGASSDNHYYNNEIRSCGFQGILLQGQGGSTLNAFGSFFDINNEIGSVNGGTARFFDIGGGTGSVNGVALTGQNGAKIYGCLFDSIWVTSGAANALLFGTSTSAGDSTVNVEAYNNQFTRIIQTAGSGTTILTAIRIPGNTNNTRAKIYNNFISNLRSNGTSANAIDAIYNHGNTNVGTKVEWYYNTILLDNQAIGVGGGNMVMRIDASATVNNLIIKNNVFVNRSAQNGGSINYIYNRTGGFFTATNNGLYIDTTIANRSIGFYTAVKKSLPAWQAASGTETSSFYENAPFINIVTLPYDLHLDTVLTQYESGATPISGITTDIDNQTRPGPPGSIHGGGTAPDVGADEFDGFPLDLLGPSISYTPLGNTTSMSNRSLSSVIITDPSGVKVASGSRPRVYYKRKSDTNSVIGNTSGSNGWKFAEANGTSSPFDFTIDYSLLFGGGGVNVGDSIQYFVVAQDSATTPNVGINSGTFAATPSSVALTATALPIGGTINFYIIIGAPLSGDYTVGVLLFNRVTGKSITFDRIAKNVKKEVAEKINNDNKDSKEPDEIKMVMKEFEEVSWIPMENGKVYDGPLYVKRADNSNLSIDAGGGVYATITAAIADLNLSGASGSVRFLLKDGTYPSETLPIIISPWTGASSTNTLTIKLDTASSAITGTSASGIFVVNGADFVTIDGSQSNTANTVCPVSTASRGLTITNTSTSTSSAVIWLQTNAGDGATNNAIKNCNLVGSAPNQTLVGAGSGSSTISNTSAGSSNNNNSYINNAISKVQYGIYSGGNSAATKNTGTKINLNTMNSNLPNNIRISGVLVKFEDGIEILRNGIAHIKQTSSITPPASGIALGIQPASTYTAYTGSDVINANVSYNSIDDVVQSATGSAYGIVINAITSGITLISNNMISSINDSNASSSDLAAGILVGGGTGSTTLIYYNSVSMLGTITASTRTAPSYALAIGGATPFVDIRNNILHNSTFISGAGKNFAIGLAYTSTVGNYVNLTSNNNDLFVNGAAGFIGKVGGFANAGGTDKTTLADWQTETGRDGASKNVLPVFVSATDLHLVTTNASNIANLNAMGTSVSVNDDIDCQTRGFSTSLIGPPDIGADEFNAVTGKHYVNDTSISGDTFTTDVGNNLNPGTSTDPFLTLTYAVSQSNPNDTIYVDAGTYVEQVLINKNLTIIGADSAGTSAAVIKAPAVIPPVVNANGSHLPIVYVFGVGDTINIHHIGIDGDGRGGVNFHGVYYYEASGSFTHSRIAKVRDTIFSGGQSGNAFFVNHAFNVSVDHTVTVSDNVIVDYQKTGILINEINTRGIVTNNIVTGQNIKNVNRENGIKLGHGAYGTIAGNSVSNNIYNGPTADVATGILLAGVGVNQFNVPTGKTTTIGGGGALANNLIGNEVGLLADEGGLGYNSNAGVTYNGDNFSNQDIHVSLNAPPLVPSGANTYDKRVDNTSQINIVYGRVQRSVNGASPGNTLIASAHTFQEQVLIGKAMTLMGQGIGLTTILSPNILLFSYTTSNINKPVIYVHDTTGIIIKNLTVDGAGKGNANSRFQGIAYHDAGGIVRDCEIKDIRNSPIDGAPTGVGIFALADSGTIRTLNIIRNNVHDFQKNGMALSGTNLTASVDSNTIHGAGAVSFTAQNGVQLSFGATGSITNNTITGFSYTPAIVVATGVLVLDATDSVTSSGNTINDAQVGICYIQSSGIIHNNIVRYNDVNMGTTPYWYGINVEDGTTTVRQNTVNGGGNGAGIEVDAVGTNDAVRIEADAESRDDTRDSSDAMLVITSMNATNNFVDSTDVGFVIYVAGTGNANVTINENSITNSVTYAIRNYGNDTVDATCNWYGAANASFIASKINGLVTYIPFLTNGTDSQSGTPGFQPVPGSCNGFPLITGELDLTICLEACSPNEDTVSVCLRSTTSPYPVIGCATGIIDSTGNVSLNYSNVSNGPSYYIVVNHRNSIETWSATGQTFTSGFMTYDFTIDTSQAFGGNMTFVSGNACIYTGDVNQDGAVDGSDAARVENDAFNFKMGYIVTDLNCDEVVDGTDAAYVDNNAFKFVVVEKPAVFGNDTKTVNVEKASIVDKLKIQNSIVRKKMLPMK